MIAVLTLGAGSCVDDGRFRVGYATFFIEFYDPVIDRFGVVQLAYCARNLTFTGDIDTSCRELPMVYSFGMNAFVTCTYRDAAGVPWSYTDLFYFWPGYIQEPACFPGYLAPDEEPVMDLTRDTMLGRDDEGRVMIDDEITLSAEQVDLEVLRDDLRVRTREPFPSTLPDGLAEDPIRASETRLGEPPADVNAPIDPDQATTLERDAQGRVIVPDDVELSGERQDVERQRQDLEGITGERAPDELPSNGLADPVRTSETQLGEP